MGKKIRTAAILIVIAILIAAGFSYMLSDMTVGRRYLWYSYYDGAVNSFLKAIKKNPNNAQAHIYLGIAYGKKREYDKALQEFQWLEAKAANIRLPAQTHNDIGMIYYLLEKYDFAIAQFNKAVAAKPKYADAYFNLGAAYSAAGKSREAIEAYDKVVQLSPRNAYAHWNLAINLEKINDIDGAIEHWEKYIQFVLGVFRNPDAQNHLAELKALRLNLKKQADK
jgi:tetratricopeptide (TPR) repeat protein